MQSVLILAIESSCDDTSAAVIDNNKILANIVANQEVHKAYGGVVPELASRSHQKNIVPVVERALQVAGVSKEELHAIAFTRGPGLLGSLLVGASFARSMAWALGIPLIDINHMQAHILAHFIVEKEGDRLPEFPFLCLTVSGGHTQLVLVKDHFDMEVIGQTIDDAAGEAFDKVAKMLGLEYPGGPLVDRYAREGDPLRFSFPHPRVGELEFSFSGLKTAVLYFLKEQMEQDEKFIEKNMADICASVQRTVVDILLDKLQLAARKTGARHIALAGGVSANSELRKRLLELGEQEQWEVYIPPFQYCTDNAGMIAIAAYYKYLRKDFAGLSVTPLANTTFDKA